MAALAILTVMLLTAQSLAGRESHSHHEVASTHQLRAQKRGDPKDPWSDEYIPVHDKLYPKVTPIPPAKGTVSAPCQGFEGRDCKHVDTETATGDWGIEYGPHMKFWGGSHAETARAA